MEKAKNPVNRLYKMTSDETRQYCDKIDTDTICLVELDGKKLLTFKDYYAEMTRIFKFPPAKRPNLDGYSDWMRDDFFFNKDAYLLVIRDYNKFLSRDKKRKQQVFECFVEDVLPWWEGEVEKYSIVDGEPGKPKSFNVILVQDNPAE
jgi:hypothetical protein